MGSVHGRLQVRVEIRVNVLGNVSRHLHGCRGNRTRDWLLVVLLEPLHEFVHTAVNLVPIPEPIWCDGRILDSWFLGRLISQHKLAGIFRRNAEKIRNSFRIFLLFLSEKFLERFVVASISSSVALVS